ncbi:MAG: acyltransferase family protein [Clostridia bacterium]|nr:acyltransferase family protein [Clostridia bacterium]
MFATFAVMVLHASASTWFAADVNGFQWKTVNFYICITRWGVPVFAMISGALFLNRDIPIRRIYSRYICRLAISFAVWAIIYAAFAGGSIRTMIASAAVGYYHMWYILMTIGLYMCIPLIKPIVRNEAGMKYYLVLAFIFAFAIPEIVTLAKSLGNETVIKAAGALDDNLHDMSMHVVLGYTGYFILGYFLHRITLSRKQRIAIYVSGLSGFVFTVGMELLFASRNQYSGGIYIDYFSVNILMESIAVFTFCRYHQFKGRRWNQLFKNLSKYSFGAYLVHVLVIEQVTDRMGLDVLSFNPVLSVPCTGFAVFVLSFSVSALLNRIPAVNQYIV